MSWILLATSAQLLNAIVAVIDKYLVTDEKALPRPFVYAFYSCLVAGFWLVIYVIGFVPGLAELGFPQLTHIKSPSIQVVGMSFFAAYTFFMALVSMYDALKNSDASDAIPVIGAVSAISSFGLSFIILGIQLEAHYIWGIVLLAIGTLLVSQVRFNANVALHTIHSGVFFALHYIAMKGLFDETSFDDGFFWSRIFIVLFALSMLLVPAYLEKIKEQTIKTSARTGWLVMVNKVLAGAAAFMILKATDLGEVAVVQALDGLKFVFILLIGVFLGRFIPKAAGENENDWRTVFRKSLYVVVIFLGYVILFTG